MIKTERCFLKVKHEFITEKQSNGFSLWIVGFARNQLIRNLTHKNA